MPPQPSRSDFEQLLSDYQELSEKCRTFWKSTGLIGAWPAMWAGMRQDQNKLHRRTEEARAHLLSLQDQYPELADIEVPELPEKDDPFDLARQRGSVRPSPEALAKLERK